MLESYKYFSNNRNHEGTILDTPACELNEWSDWSSCTTSCGDGSMTRSRNFIHKKNRKHCKAVANGPDLQQTIDCENEPCENEEMERVSEVTMDDDNVVDDDYEGAGDGEAGDEEDEDEMKAEAMEVIEEWLQVRNKIAQKRKTTLIKKKYKRNQ